MASLAGVEEAELEVEKLVAGGEGLARLSGVPVFIARAAPGDRLRVRLVEHRPDYARAEILEILVPGPGRRPDPYPELGRTGICDLQHLEDDLQPRLKAAAVLEALSRIGRLELPAEVPLVTGDPWGYRLRTQLHTGVGPGGEVLAGYHARGSHELIVVERCPVLVPELEALLPLLPQVLTGKVPRRLDLAAGDDGEVTVAPVVAGLPHGEVTMAVAGFSFAYDARCFFQGHRGLLSRLVAAAVGEWEGEEAFDLYAGAGLFSLPLSRLYRRVTAIEADPIAGRFGRTNARRNRLLNVEGVTQVAESWVARLSSHASRVIVDPPRAGLSSKVRHALLASRPQRLTYVSCHAATLARDLRHLDTGFLVEKLTLLDLFPQTGHMEVVAQLVAR